MTPPPPLALALALALALEGLRGSSRGSAQGEPRVLLSSRGSGWHRRLANPPFFLLLFSPLQTAPVALVWLRPWRHGRGGVAVAVEAWSWHLAWPCSQFVTSCWWFAGLLCGLRTGGRLR